jgi:hypothetical protein
VTGEDSGLVMVSTARDSTPIPTPWKASCRGSTRSTDMTCPCTIGFITNSLMSKLYTLACTRGEVIDAGSPNGTVPALRSLCQLHRLPSDDLLPPRRSARQVSHSPRTTGGGCRVCPWRGEGSICQTRIERALAFREARADMPKVGLTLIIGCRKRCGPRSS